MTLQGPRLGLLRALPLALLCAIASAQYASSGPPRPIRPPVIPPEAKDVAMKGEHVCLRGRPDANGRIQLDCAIGLRGDDDRFYDLVAADPTQIEMPEMQLRVRVTGKWVPYVVENPRYDVAGRIFYTKKEYLRGDPKSVTGTFVCFAPSAGAPPGTKCRNGIETAGRMKWGLESASFNALPAARMLKLGDRVSLTGDIVPDSFQDWVWWMGWDGLEGVLSVRTLQRVPPK